MSITFFKSHNALFLFPLAVLLLGLLAVAQSLEQSAELRDEQLRQQFESDAALRFLVRDALAARLQTHLKGFIAALAAPSAEDLGETITRAGNIIESTYGSDTASQIVHFYVATVTSEQRVVISFSYPRPQLVGREISDHPMLRDLDFSARSGRIQQIDFLASRENDLSFTSESPLVIRRHVFQHSVGDLPVIGIVKLNLVETEKYIDSQLRDLGSVALLETTHYDPRNNRCLLRYTVGSGVGVCPGERPNDVLQYRSERNGFSSVVTATAAYAQQFENKYPRTFYLPVVLMIVATFIAGLVTIFVRARLISAEEEIKAYQGSLYGKEALTDAIHTVVADNLTQLEVLARRVKDAPDIAETERRYLNIALSEIIQLRLSVDAKIMADRNDRGREPIEDATEKFLVDELAKTIEVEIKRLTSGEGVETRVLLDESLKGEVWGSEYWTESALLAFINASLIFSDESFIEMFLWTEFSPSGERELLARIRDEGIAWSLEDSNLDHPSITSLRAILDGLGATITSSAVSETGSQEHIIRFARG